MHYNEEIIDDGLGDGLDEDEIIASFGNPLVVGFVIFMISTGSFPSVLFNLGTLCAVIGLAILSFYASYALTRPFKQFTLRLWTVTTRQVKRIASYPFDKREDPVPAAPHDSWSLIICDTAR